MSFIPPMRDGISASQLYLPKQEYCTTIYQYVCQQFPHISSDEWQQRFMDGLVYHQDGFNIDLNTSYQHGITIYYYRHLKHETPVPFAHHIIFENEHLLVVDKPHFLTVSPTGKYVQQTLLTRLKQQYQYHDLSPIHRLDRETAGIILFSKQKNSRNAYQQLFVQHQIQKTYHAIAPYRTDLVFPKIVQKHLQKGEPFYTMKIVDDAEPNSETWIDILQVNSNQQLAKYILKPKTGKQHQLRVHLNALNIPILNDRLYPIVQHKDDDDFSQPLQLLAKSIEFIDPITEENQYFTSKFDLSIAI